MNLLYFVKKWPRKSFSAPHQRIFSIIGSLVNFKYNVIVASSENMIHQNTYQIQQYPVTIKSVNPNQNLDNLKQKPLFVFFDTYQTEQNYSSQIYNRYNKAIRVLDLQDIHSLRFNRQKQLKKDIQNGEKYLIKKGSPMWIKNGISKQQLSSINRSDMIITCSEFEYYHLKKQIPQINICYLSFAYPITEYLNQVNNKEYRPFKHRKNFIFIGNMEFAPNQDAVRILIQQIWPRIHKQLPNQQLHIYGSNFPSELLEYKQEFLKSNIRIGGLLQSLSSIQQYRLMLVPLRYGGGIKGKIIDSWYYHTPVITTPIGSQGMFEEICEETLVDSKKSFFRQKLDLSENIKKGQSNLREYYDKNIFGQDSININFGGSWRNYTFEQFAQNSVNLYTDKQKWQKCRQIGQRTILKNHIDVIGEKNLFGMLSDTELKLKILRNNQRYNLQWENYMLRKLKSKRMGKKNK